MVSLTFCPMVLDGKWTTKPSDEMQMEDDIREMNCKGGAAWLDLM